jgi:ABC-2 type transport system permease protein
MDDRFAAPQPPAALAPPAPRLVGAFNLRGTWTLYLKEVRRFVKVGQQTLMAPVVTTLLFLAIFSLALGGSVRMIGTIHYDQFLAPGLVMMAIVQNSFANTSSSLVIAKIQGNIVDVLMPPLSPSELTLGYVLSGVTRGLLVGAACTAAMTIFVEVHFHDVGLVLYYAAMAALMLSLLGLMGGIWADKFDHIAAVTNFIVMPASFLSGTFYSIDRLPGVWNWIAHLDPLFYLIDGFRAGFIGQADAPVWIGMLAVAGINAALWAICHAMFARGYKLKA